MPTSIPEILQENWPLFKEYGLTKTCIFQEMDNPDYNRDTGVVTGTIISSNELEIIFSEFGFTAVSAPISKDDETAILSIDKKAVFAALDLPVIPKINDRVVVSSTSKKWRVIGISVDPAEAHYELHIRPL